MTRIGRLAVVLALALIAALVICAGPALAAGPAVSQVGTRPQIPAGAQAVGTLSQSTTIRAAVALAPRDPAALATYAEAVSTPGSASYHSYLTVAQFGQRFGPEPAEVAAVRSSLRARGLQPGALDPNGLALSVVAPAGRLASAFSTSFERYHLQNGQTAYANTSAPSVATSIAGVVQSVIGLNNLATPRPELLQSAVRGHAVAAPRVATGGPQPCAAAKSNSAGYGSYTADQIASAYRFSSLYGASDLGTGVTVALYELEPYASSDIRTYQTCYGTSASVSNVAVDGGAGRGAGSGEAALDIEDVVGLAPNANILVYEGPNAGSGAYDTYSKIISQGRAQVISTTWGLCEASEGPSEANAENVLFEEAAVQGQSMLAAAGDSGADDCGGNRRQAGVDDPASQPYVTGVGGTTLSSLGPAPSETVWNDGYPHGAGGGGVSSLWTMPSYQSSAPASLGVINSQSSKSACASTSFCREVPDASVDADPDTGYEIYWNGGWLGIGGTSAAAPTWAALTALADASSACASTKVGFSNPALYRARAASNSYFNDVTSGNNSYDGVSGFDAFTGYDMASGLGTPSGAALAAALCGSSDTVSVTNPGPQSSTVATAVRLQLSATSSARTPVTYAASDLPSGLSINPSTGLVSGTATVPGTFLVEVSASDASGSTGQASFSWSVTGASSATPTTPTTPSPPTTMHVVTISKPSAQNGRVGVSQRLRVHASDSSGFAIAYSATGLPAGLSINSGSGLISGTPRKSGRATVTVKATDRSGSSATVAFFWTIAGRPRSSQASLRLVRGSRATLSLSLNAGVDAAALKSLVITVPNAIHLSARARNLKRGVSAWASSGAHLVATSHLRRGALMITLSTAQRRATLRISAPEIWLSQRLITGVRARRVREVKLVVVATDAGDIRTRLVVTASAA